MSIGKPISTKFPFFGYISTCRLMGSIFPRVGREAQTPPIVALVGGGG